MIFSRFGSTTTVIRMGGMEADLGETVCDVNNARAQLVAEHAHHFPRSDLVRQVLNSSESHNFCGKAGVC